MNKYLEKVAKLINLSNIEHAATSVFKPKAPKMLQMGTKEADAIYNRVKARLPPQPGTKSYFDDIHSKINHWKSSIVE